MFWENFVTLCAEKNKKPTQVICELNISRGNVTHWKNGIVPKDVTIKKIADYFKVSPEELIKEKLTTKGSELMDENVVIFHRDGKTVTKKFTPAQMELIEKLLNEIPGDK